MTSRRSFLKRLAVAGAGVATGATLLSDRFTAAPAPERVAKPHPQINPAWIDAPYEEKFFFHQDFTEYLAQQDCARLTEQIVEHVSAESPWLELIDA